MQNGVSFRGWVGGLLAEQRYRTRFVATFEASSRGCFKTGAVLTAHVLTDGFCSYCAVCSNCLTAFLWSFSMYCIYARMLLCFLEADFCNLKQIACEETLADRQLVQ